MTQNTEENKRKKYYFPEAQKRYGKKIKTYAVKYSICESESSKKLDEYLRFSGMSANKLIKQAIEEYMGNHPVI